MRSQTERLSEDGNVACVQLRQPGIGTALQSLAGLRERISYGESDRDGVVTTEPLENPFRSLVNVESKNPLKCRVGASGPTCWRVFVAFRLLGSAKNVGKVLKIDANAAITALLFSLRYPRSIPQELAPWYRLASATLGQGKLV